MDEVIIVSAQILAPPGFGLWRPQKRLFLLYHVTFKGLKTNKTYQRANSYSIPISLFTLCVEGWWLLFVTGAFRAKAMVLAVTVNSAIRSRCQFKWVTVTVKMSNGGKNTERNFISVWSHWEGKPIKGSNEPTSIFWILAWTSYFKQKKLSKDQDWVIKQPWSRCRLNALFQPRTRSSVLLGSPQKSLFLKGTRCFWECDYLSSRVWHHPHE